ncbi:MAG: ABC transporter substrate binding protein, partial [Desulfuromonadaceae bacterium]
NWDASEYHLPRSQVTGMIEVQPIDQLVATLLPFAHGSRVGFLKGKDFSASKEFDAIENFLGISLQCRLVVDFAEWLRSYEELQRNCDVLLLGNPVSIRDWDAARAREVIAERTRIPTGAWDAWMREYALVTFATDPAEQGIWAAAAAKAILAGRSPAEIPVVRNRKAKIFRNMAMAKQLGVVFPMEFIRQSWAVERNISK